MALTTEQRDWLKLVLVPGVGSTHFIRLLGRFHTPGNVLRAGQGALKELVGPALAQRIANYGDDADIDTQNRLMAQYNVQLITLDDPGYPTRLAEIYDPPLLLFVRGDLRETDDNCVAIVGTRRPTPYGIRMAERFAGELAARGITVVSGMAMGVDAAAHRGALEAGGRTIAVLGCGVDVVYPPQNAELMDQIIAHGSAISQFPMGAKPARGHFPYRNRIISGMTLGTLIVEAPPRSGALITARQAAEQGRDVFAVPGQVGTTNSQGPHALIREGATLAESVEDILVELNLPAQQRARPAPSPTPPPAKTPEPREAAPAPAPTPAPPESATPSERDVLSVLSPDGSFVDEIAAACRIPVSEALSSLTMLELKGLVRQFSGKRFAPR